MKRYDEHPFLLGANPYMPLWEHVPDGEPRVFCVDGKKRVYVYGSHDTLKNEYCGRDYVVWSAPVENLNDWTCHGVCYRAEDNSVLFAPDVVEKDGVYYLYAAEQRGSRITVARSSSPLGPFTDPVLTQLGFDPGVLVDDDGRVYAYWGFCGSFCAELQPDMASIVPGTLHENPIRHCMAPWSRNDGFNDDREGFFEASSPHKVMGKYIYIYSRRHDGPVPELGVTGENNGFLSYMWSDHPLEGFREGGDISFNGGEILKNPDGTGIMTYRWGNNHGSLAEVNGQWYIFYHRQTGTDEYSRQAMMEPVEVAFSPEGKPLIGRVLRSEGVPVASVPVEMTSQGAMTGGMDAFFRISAGRACHLRGGRENAYILPVYEKKADASAPVVNIYSGLTAGYRYLHFGDEGAVSVTLSLSVKQKLTVSLRLDEHDGPIAARAELLPGKQEAVLPLFAPVKGRHAVYFVFEGGEDDLAVFDGFTFD